MPKERLAGLDLLRGIAALSVLAYHTLPVLTGAWRGNAYLAVDFFFMLSGYVMARTYEARLAEGLRPSAFVAARCRRLWPTMFAAGLLGLPGFFIVYGFGQLPVAVANLLLIPVLTMRWVYPLNAPAWSIFFELFANAVHALLLRRLPRLLLILLALAMVPILVPVASRLTFDLGAHAVSFAYGFPRVLLSYAIGVALWRWWRDEPTVAVSPDCAFLAMPLFFGAGAFYGGSWQGGLVFILLLCPMMIAGGLRWQGAGAPFARLAGAMSFPLYALHTPIFTAVELAGLNILWGVLLSLGAAYLFTRIAGRGRRLGPSPSDGHEPAALSGAGRASASSTAV